MTNEAGFVLIMIGWIASACVGGLLWERHFLYRTLPILYGILVGIYIVIQFGHSGWRLLESLLAGVGVGALLLFAVWVDGIRVAKNSNPQQKP